MAIKDGAGTVLGTSGVLGSAALFAVLSGSVFGQATVIGDCNPQGAGLVLGSSSVYGEGTSQFFVSSSISGGSSSTALISRLVIASGTIAGVGSLEWDYFVNGSGQASGIASVSGSGIRTLIARVRFLGTSSMALSGAPMPIRGYGILVGYPVVDRHLPAVQASVDPPKGFRYLQVLQRGDLPIYLCTKSGPVSPFWIAFTMYRVLPCGARQRVGPYQRTPVSGAVGEYYATGRAGESSQPGNWVIVWDWRQHFNGALETKEMEFQVLDAVAAADPRDTTIRCRKYGWS